MGKLTFVKARKGDEEKMSSLLHDMAHFEKLEKEVTFTTEKLASEYFVKKAAVFLFIKVGGETIGYLTYFFNFSSFKGHRCLYLEDLFVYPEQRGRGYGKAAFVQLARIAQKEGCERIDWVCLAWNRKAQIFYETLGATKHQEWLLYRLEKKGIGELAQEKDNIVCTRNPRKR